MAFARNGPRVVSFGSRRMRGRTQPTRLLVFLGFLVTGLVLWRILVAVSSKSVPRNSAADGLGEVCDRKQYPAVWELRGDQLTVLINGFAEERLPLLQSHVRFFSSFSIVNAVFILWGNVSTPDSVLDEVEFTSLGAPIYVVRQSSLSLNHRFLPRPYIKTRAVMICDDDITVDGDSLEFSFRTWMNNQKQIVGFFPRAHSYQLDSNAWIYTKLPNQYSIMLTKLMILATEYLFLYTCNMPQGVREYVDQGMNCEDLAMNFVVSNHSGLGPLLVEGKPRDWGDTRNSAGEMSNIGLSARAGHRKNRGDCITAFHRLWGGMELKFSYGKMSPYKEEQALCDKFGYLINCDEPVASKRHAQRLAGKNVVAVKEKHAFVTVLSSRKQFNSSLALAQSLSSSGSVHDIVLLLHPSTGISTRDSILEQHYDVVRKMKHANVPAGFHALNTLLLSDYAKVVYIHVESLVLQNLDHLFNLADPAAAPHVSFPGQFDTSLLVLKPSKITFTKLLELVDELPVQSRTMHHLLNLFHSGWYHMSADHRLPARYNAPKLFSTHLAALSDMFGDVNRTYNMLGSLALVKSGKPLLTKMSQVMQDDCDKIAFCRAWLELFNALRGNDLNPLVNTPVSLPQTSSVPAVNTTGNVMWPPKSHPHPKRWFSLSSVGARCGNNCTTAIATTMWDSRQGILLQGWAASFARHHPHAMRRHTLLLVSSTLDKSTWQPYSHLFDMVRVVDPLVADGRGSQMVLHLWNQTSFSKLAYADPGSIFQDNCFSLFDYGSPFSAIPSSFPPDRFSTRLMVVEPNEQTFLHLVSKLRSSDDVQELLNVHYNDWYQQPPSHRIAPWFSRDVKAVISGLIPDATAPESKICCFSESKYDHTWQSHPALVSQLAELWGEALCSHQWEQKPSLCGLTDSGKAVAATLPASFEFV